MKPRLGFLPFDLREMNKHPVALELKGGQASSALVTTSKGWLHVQAEQVKNSMGEVIFRANFRVWTHDLEVDVLQWIHDNVPSVLEVALREHPEFSVAGPDELPGREVEVIPGLPWFVVYEKGDLGGASIVGVGSRIWYAGVLLDPGVRVLVCAIP